MEDLRNILGFKDASWATGEVQKALDLGLINSIHDPNEPVTFGILITIMNNLYFKLKG